MVTVLVLDLQTAVNGFMSLSPRRSLHFLVKMGKSFAHMCKAYPPNS